MKKILPFIAMAIFGVAVWGGWSLWSEQKHAKASGSAPAEPAPASSDHDGKEDLTRSIAPNQQPLFVTIDNLHIPIIGDDGPEQLLSLIVSLEVKDLPTAENVRVRTPRLADAYMRALYGALYRGSIRNGTLVDVTKVKRKLEVATEEVLGPNIVRNVLVQAVAQRRL